MRLPAQHIVVPKNVERQGPSRLRRRAAFQSFLQDTNNLIPSSNRESRSHTQKAFSARLETLYKPSKQHPKSCDLHTNSPTRYPSSLNCHPQTRILSYTSTLLHLVSQQSPPKHYPNIDFSHETTSQTPNTKTSKNSILHKIYASDFEDIIEYHLPPQNPDSWGHSLCAFPWAS